MFARCLGLVVLACLSLIGIMLCCVCKCWQSQGARRSIPYVARSEREQRASEQRLFSSADEWWQTTCAPAPLLLTEETKDWKGLFFSRKMVAGKIIDRQCLLCWHWLRAPHEKNSSPASIASSSSRANPRAHHLLEGHQLMTSWPLPRTWVPEPFSGLEQVVRRVMWHFF